MSDVDLHLGDSAEVLAGASDCQVDAVVTDPPAGISFMGKDWDGDQGGRDQWVDGMAAIFRECLRVLKPGGHALVWALPRTSHWTATALEDAGFEVRDVVTHHFGTGFPKSLDVSKAIDKAAGAKREVTGPRMYADGTKGHWTPSDKYAQDDWTKSSTAKTDTAPATDDAKRWEGFGTALKPASEHWILARRPLEGTVAANVLRHGTGALNIDGCRTETESRSTGHKGGQADSGGHGRYGKYVRPDQQKNYDANKPSGRWPANLVLSHSPDCVEAGTRKVKSGTAVNRNRPEEKSTYNASSYEIRLGPGADQTYAGADGTEEVSAWECAPGCPVAELDAQSGELKARGNRGPSMATKKTPVLYGPDERRSGDEYNHGGTGGASRFFYTAKASRKDRGEGNDHPTVKSTALMRWLVRLVTPPGGAVLDPFMGSGSTGVAALEEGFDFVGIERDPHYFEIAKRRLGR